MGEVAAAGCRVAKQASRFRHPQYGGIPGLDTRVGAYARTAVQANDTSPVERHHSLNSTYTIPPHCDPGVRRTFCAVEMPNQR